jgi:beta-glucosidase
MEPKVIKADLKLTTKMPGWEVFPPIAEMVLVEFSRRYPKIPLYVTENGAAFDDPKPDASGRVADPRRLAYIRDHLIHAKRALDLGVDLKGWYVWSLMDNFEWRFGYEKRFGLHALDYSNYKRYVKDSGIWFKDVIKNNGFNAEDLPACKSPYK